jgi:predicted transcriptional regulator
MARLDARVEVRVDTITLQRLESRAAIERRSVAQVIREALARYLDEKTPATRRAALEAAFAAIGPGLPVPDDPQELKRQMREADDAEMRAELEFLPPRGDTE